MNNGISHDAYNRNVSNRIFVGQRMSNKELSTVGSTLFGFIIITGLESMHHIWEPIDRSIVWVRLGLPYNSRMLSDEGEKP